jgi:CDP-4-dehydro-6-deoxyglucose reductase
MARITLQPSGHCFEAAAGESVLAAALRQQLHLPHSCRSGRCGSCMAQLLQGTVSYPAGLPSAITPQQAAAGRVLLCQAQPDGDLTVQAREVAGVEGLEPRLYPCRVTARELLAPDVMRLLLKLPQGQALRFRPGQYLDFILQGGKRRSFSMAAPPAADGQIELHIRRVPGGHFTGHVFDAMQDKALLRLEAPLGTFFLREENDAPVLLVGGGTGFAPLKAMLEDALPRLPQRRFHLFWGARARRDLYLDALPRAWADQYPNFRYTPVLSEAMSGDVWTGEAGWVHEAVLRLYPNLAGNEVYMSGPPPMVAAARDAFVACGLDPERLYFDSFEYAAA